MHHLVRTLSTVFTLGFAATVLTEPTARRSTMLLIGVLIATVLAEQILLAR
jgi:hypothetical protein